MKKIFGTLLVFSTVTMIGSVAFAADEAPPTLAQEVASGFAILQKLQTSETSCAKLSQNEFELLGEYFMDQMMGDSHEAMNAALQQRLGQSGEEAMHIAMGERFSGCNSSAATPVNRSGFFPMMQMMGGTFTPAGWAGRTMMGGWELASGWTAIDWLWMLVWYLVIVMIIALGVRWLVNTRHLHLSHRSSLEILKERYAKGELNKEHYEEMKKELLK